ncbi:MFS transporter [Deefgea salmonis]|uniref:MFS transporter n=1 Tax=Deefgea salmonis TaxID=2875502 RepID=A0ABS8BGG8_9NEIS|nr:MFS transporter [Deefgea salmonis]MCB5194792.1 MFS transporter [Deefgea salmonis]
MIISSVSLRRSQLAVAALFLVLGFNFGTWASRIPTLKMQLDLSAAEVGILLLASGLGAVFSFPITATLLHKLGSRKLCLLAGSAIPLILIALSLAPTFPLAMAVMALEGIAVACLNVAMNSQGVEVELAGKQAIMSRLHAVFSLGGLLAALFASGLTLLTDSLWIHFVSAAGLLWLGVAFARKGLLPEQIKDAEQSNGKRFVMPKGIALWLGLIALCGTVVEGSMSDWSALYLKEMAGASAQLAPLGIACVSGTMLIARWLGDGWRTRWGAERMLTGGGLLAGVGLAMALVIGGVVPALIGFALVGLGVAAVSPCVYAAAAKHGAVALAAVTTMGSIGALMGPPLIGFIAHASNLAWGMAVIALAATLIAWCTRRVDWR